MFNLQFFEPDGKIMKDLRGWMITNFNAYIQRPRYRHSMDINKWILFDLNEQIMASDEIYINLPELRHNV